MLVLLALPLAIVALLIKLTSPGPGVLPAAALGAQRAAFTMFTSSARW